MWTIPKALRPAFRRDRKLLGELCRCAWRSLRQYVEAGWGPGSLSGAVFAIQTYGDQLNFHPHLHSLVSGRTWHRDGVCSPIDGGDSQVITRLFQHHVLQMLVSRRRLSRDFADKLRSWRHSGFQAYGGPPVGPEDQPALERGDRKLLFAGELEVGSNEVSKARFGKGNLGAGGRSGPMPEEMS